MENTSTNKEHKRSLINNDKTGRVFNEDTRVKIPAILTLTRLGYEYLSLKDAKWDKSCNIFTDIFRDSIKRINKDKNLSDDDVERLQQDISLELDNEDLGRKFYERLISQSGIKIVDFENFDNNTFNVVTELKYRNDGDEFRPDITVLINGMPLCFIEVKTPNNTEGIIAERDRIDLRFSNKKFRKFINISQILVFSNNQNYDEESIVPIHGAFYSTTSISNAKFNCFREDTREFEKLLKIKEENSDIEDVVLKDTNNVAIKHSQEFKTNKQLNLPTNRLLISLFSKERLKDFLYYAICYCEIKDDNGNIHLEKQIMRYPQYFASKAIQNKLDDGIKRGIIWHTQGSGKTALAYYNVRLLQDYFARKNIVPRFYFIVDRLDLKQQAEESFFSRGLKVHSINSKRDFEDDIKTNKSANSNNYGKNEITVINIQKIPSDISVSSSDYNINIQRIYFIDEAHRSYKETGCYFANLMSLDKNAIFISLTGTPLLSSKSRSGSKDLWGDYIHQYYYNSSIQDGYTLKLIREDIETQYKTELKTVLGGEIYIKHGDLVKNDVYSNEKFVKPMLDYIVNDMKKTRIFSNDNSIGGMVVCSSSQQAIKFFEIFNKEYKGKATNKNDVNTSALILCEVDDKETRKSNINKFKKGSIDILFVYNMLLTGFDAPRLKKLYIDRELKEHNLLQTLTRVNRPYKNFKYGYIVDFTDIREEFDKVNNAYWNELKRELGDEIKEYSNIFKTEEEINKDMKEINETLLDYNTENLELFSQQINEIKDKIILLKIRKALNSAKELGNIIRSTGNTELYNKFDFKTFNELLKMVEHCIFDVNYMERIKNKEDISEILNIELENIVFNFRKTGEEELKIADELKNMLKKTRETLVTNIDKKDPAWISLTEELRKILAQENIYEISQYEKNITLSNELFEKATKLNKKNDSLLEKYGNDKKIVRIHNRIKESPDLFSKQDKIIICENLYDLKIKVDDYFLKRNAGIENEAYSKREIETMMENEFATKKIEFNTKQFDYIKNLFYDEYRNASNGVVE